MQSKVLVTQHYMLRGAVILLCLAMTRLCAWAQTGKLFDADKQLSSSFTNQVYIDRDGFIWGVTRNGLNKYDGYQFHIIRQEAGTENGLASNYVNAIMQDKDGLFYLGMYGALQTYDGSRYYDVEVRDLDNRVVRCYVTCFLQLTDGTVIAGTSGHGVLRFEDRYHARQIGGELDNVLDINDMIADQNGHVWMVTSHNGLGEFDGLRMKWHFSDEAMQADVRRVAEDTHGNIFVGTASHGVFVKWNPTFQHNVMAMDSGEQMGAFQHITATGSKHVSAIKCLKNGKVIIGLDGQGVQVFTPETGDMVDNPFYSREVDLSMSKVYSIVEDGSGNIWLGLLQKGIYMQPTKTSGFHYLGYKLGDKNLIGEACVISTIVDSKGRSWIGTDKDGLYCLDGSKALIKHFKETFPSTVMCLREAPDGKIWVGAYGEGFGYVEPNSMTYHPFPGQKDLHVFAMAATADNNLWLATMGDGLLRVNTLTNEVKAYKRAKNADVDSTVNSIVNDYISHLSISPDAKRIYAATTMGVCCLDIEKESWVNVFGKNCPNYGTPTRVVKEFGGKLWIGTNNGMYCFDLASKSLQAYTVAKGIADNGIAAIEQDKRGRLWVATDHGLCCFDPKTGLSQSFFVDNGLQSNEFSDGASFTTEEGTMLFGGVGGVTWFNPQDIAEYKWEAKVRLTAFNINGKPVNMQTESGGYHVCDTTVIAAERFDLGYHDNSFAIQLSTLTYDNPEHITYLYSINEGEYVRLQPGVNEITFSNLASGTYHFAVKAEHNNQVTPERKFTVVIHAPWYRSGWAYICYLALLALGVWTYLSMRKRKEEDRLLLEQHKHAEEMGEAKLKFFMNISHEIRTPMTLIITPLLSLMKQDKDPHRHNVYETIKRNAERILNLINQIMDLRKIDKGMMKMNMQETNLVPFVADVYKLFSHQAKAKNIQFKLVTEAEKLPVWIDRKHFDKVIVNLLSNAFKFTPLGGEINIRIDSDDKNAYITVDDNGEKIPEDKINKIFERFYQSETTVNDNHFGTGIGLDLSKSLVELHHGTITARNLEQGCEFKVSIPLGNAHLKPEDMIVEDEPQKEDETMNLLLADEESEENMDIMKFVNKKYAVLVVEDDDEIRDMLKQQLSEDWDVTAAPNGKEALAELYRTAYDIVISDVMMPEMDGNTLCAQIKNNPATNHLPVILLTAKNRDEDKLEGLETGADAYIVKPFNMDILRRTIINLVSARRLLRQKYSQGERLEKQVDEVKMKSPDEKLLERIMNTINKNINNTDLSVDMIADEVGISRVHLHRKMKELTGHTPHDFIRTLRLKQAAQLLATQNMNITEVVYACGFSNPTSFSTMFKSVYGMSPRDYMKVSKVGKDETS